MVSELPGWLLQVFRWPDELYRHGWGWLLGKRFGRLTHQGRRSGRTYTAVLEVIGRDPRVPEVIVISGFGPNADWLRNIEAGGPVRITIGMATFAALPRRLRPDEAEQMLSDYERRNRFIGPIIRRVLSSLLGWSYDGSTDARRRLARQLPVVAFHPTGP